MKFLAAVHSDVGIQKVTNEDSLCLKIARLRSGEEVAMLVVCDGMGGCEKGELASATVVKAFSDWFDNSLPKMFKEGSSTGRVIEDWETQILKEGSSTGEGYSTGRVKEEWEKIIREQNDLLVKYGESHHLVLGTTLTAIMLAKDTFIVCQIGDSRAYRVTDSIEQITEDQTVVQRDIKLGLITEEQAKTHPRQNTLLQCIGHSEGVEPVYTEGVVKSGEQFMLCSDGFRHELSEDVMLGILSSKLMKNEAIMKKSLVDLIELNKERKERDNITATLIKVV